MAKKKRNPNDSTFRNITALKKRVKVLETEMGLVMRTIVQALKARKV